jgi:hypothetical protein
MKPSAVFVWLIVSGCVTGCGSAIDAGRAVDQVLVPDARGWVDLSTSGGTGIQGQWHALGDSRFGLSGGSAGSCRSTDYGECSIVREPALGSSYAPTAGLGMCTSGLIPRWITDSVGLTPDGSPGLGGIELELDMPAWPEPRTELAAPAARAYDADAHGVTGFAFDIDSEPAPGASLLVQVVSAREGSSLAESEPAYWGGARLDASPVHAGHNEFEWNDVGPSQLTPTRLLRLGFLVLGNDARAVAYDFCIDHLTALRSPSRPSAPFASDDQPLVPDETGWVARATTGKTKIQGQWFSAADGIGPDTPCRLAGYPECSVFSDPDPTSGDFPPRAGLGMCTSGVVAKTVVGADGTPDWSSIWGAVIAFLLNGTDFPERQVAPYDAERYGVTGFAFDIDSEPPPGAELVVELETFGTEGASAWWGGNTAQWSPVHAGHNAFRWRDVGGPNYLEDPPRFDPSKLIQIGFHVPSNPTRSVSYSFCINNLTALRH